MTSSRHGTAQFFIEGEGWVGGPDSGPQRKVGEEGFRFSRLGPRGKPAAEGVRIALAKKMTGGEDADGVIPAGYTYLGQFVDHDLTFDQTTVSSTDNLNASDLLQGRSPSLDLDALYGAGPEDPVSADFYTDGIHLKSGTTTGDTDPPPFVGFDFLRRGRGTKASPRRAVIPDLRNDENLAVAQTHLAFLRFHNRVVDTLPNSVPKRRRFREARRSVVLHYQWLLQHDYLPRICDAAIVDDVFTNGRKLHEVDASSTAMPTMPVEFSVAAFRLGHSMVRSAYNWNKIFDNGNGTLDFLFDFSGQSGNIFQVPSIWVADWRRLYPFSSIGRDDLAAPGGRFNRAMRIDSRLTDVLRLLRPSAVDGSFAGEAQRLNLAYRNLSRATAIRLASGQQMVAKLQSVGVSVTPLTRDQILGENGRGVDLASLTDSQKNSVANNTPLWLYILREAENNGGRLGDVGARIVAETFHRSMEGSRHSIVRDPAFRPTLGEGERFTMMDLLLFAFENKKSLIAPLG
jgi:hypothetical protein